MSDAITSFTGHYHFLSNFYYQKTGLVIMNFRDGEDLSELAPLSVPTVEHAFQAAKTHDLVAKREIAQASSPGAAKRAGRSVALRADWDAVKLAVMYGLLRQKFASNRELGERLRATEDRMLMEGNTWKDYFWGVHHDTLVGYNWLGRLLMLVRSELVLVGG